MLCLWDPQELSVQDRRQAKNTKNHHDPPEPRQNSGPQERRDHRPQLHMLQPEAAEKARPSRKS